MKSGTERYYFMLVEAFKAKGDEVWFFAMHDAENEPCYQSPYFVSYVCVNGGIKSKLKMVLHIAYEKGVITLIDASV